MHTRISLLFVLVVSWASICSPASKGDIIVTGRLSEVAYNSINLTDGIWPLPPQHVSITSTSPTAPFNELLTEVFEFFTVVGAHNTGQLSVAQYTTFSTTKVSSEVSQFALTTTDFDDPALYTTSRFQLDFHVIQPTIVTLTGLIEGSSNPAHANFARVELIQDFGPIFSTSYSAFPFVGTLLSSHTYHLTVEAGGYSAFTDSTRSRAVVNLTTAVIPEPSSVVLCMTALALLWLARLACGWPGPAPSGPGHTRQDQRMKQNGISRA
ncbi:MAG: hypothetical protein ONB15_05415 [candidate division KSB1 bacterium]|nr:hypothetical protein [candidate division KSB1 bacterium]